MSFSPIPDCRIFFEKSFRVPKVVPKKCIFTSFDYKGCCFYKKMTFHNLFLENICTIESFFVLLHKI